MIRKKKKQKPPFVESKFTLPRAEHSKIKSYTRFVAKTREGVTLDMVMGRLLQIGYEVVTETVEDIKNHIDIYEAFRYREEGTGEAKKATSAN